MLPCRLLTTALAVACAATAVSGQIRVVNYNTLDGPTPGVHDNSANLQTIFGAIATQSAVGIARRPDLIILQEQTNTSASALASLLNTTYGLTGAYVAVQPGGQPGSSDPVFIDRQAFVYNTQSLAMIGSATTISTSAQRPVIRAQFRPLGYSSPAASFYAYGAHLMASDPTGRANQTAAMRANANTFPGAHILFAGDFNMQNNGETAWQNLVTGAGDGLAVDPLNPGNASQTWNNNSAFASIHTQSTRVGATPDGDGGATGGMDDRFDVQLSTQEMQDGEGLSYIPGTYRAFGQDGQHFNSAINAAPTIPLGAAVATALWDASDHLPVVVDYQLPARMQFAAADLPARVIQGPAIPFNVTVTNSALVATANGADELDFAISGAGSVLASGSGTASATTAGTVLSASIAVPTPGFSAGTVTASSTSQGVEISSISIGRSVQVLAHASMGFDNAATIGLVDYGVYDVSLSFVGRSVGVSNRAMPGVETALATGTGFTGDAGPFTIDNSSGFAPNWPIGSGVDTTFRPALAGVGLHERTITLLFQEEDLLNAIGHSLQLTLRGRAALGGDADLSNTVDIDDFGILASNFNQPATAWTDGDFNRDGVVDIDDFGVLAGNFNQSVAPGAGVNPRDRASVPEPYGMTGALVLVWTRRRRCRA